MDRSRRDKQLKTTLFTILTIAVPCFAQTTVKDALVKHWKTSGEFTLAVAEAMPAESYNFRPNPDEMSFGQVMAHIAVANMGACSVAANLERLKLPPKIAAASKVSPQEVRPQIAAH